MYYDELLEIMYAMAIRATMWDVVFELGCVPMMSMLIFPILGCNG